MPSTIRMAPGPPKTTKIGLVIAFGMAVGTTFTLFVTPAVYSLLARDHSKERALRDSDPSEMSARSARAAE